MFICSINIYYYYYYTPSSSLSAYTQNIFVENNMFPVEAVKTYVGITVYKVSINIRHIQDSISIFEKNQNRNIICKKTCEI